MVDCVPHDTIDWTGHSSARSSPVKRKKRRSTHSIRKEQKSELEKELQALQAKLEELELRALGERSYQHQVVQNATLRDSIQMQHMGMAQARALLSEYAQQTFSGVRPMRARICLGLDREERRRQLYALRGLKLRHAQNLVNARGYGLRPTTPYFQEEQFETEEGDFCATRYEVAALCGVQGGVRAVFDAVLQAAFNAEIVISETSGNITIREDDDQSDDRVTQMRLVSKTAGDVLLESNLVQFSEFQTTADGESYAIIATDFVDQDELYPYRPHERVRRDVTAAMSITSYLKKSGGQGTASEREELVVVVSRLFCTKVYHTDLGLFEAAKQQLHESSAGYAGIFMSCLRSILGLPRSSV